MKWIKKGLVFSELDAARYGLYNPQVPYCFMLDDKIRIFFGAREQNNGAASVYFIDVESKNPKNVLHVHEKPILSRGTIGSFDQDGVLPVCITRVNNDIYMYYGGFSKTLSSPHLCMMGLAISRDEAKSFQRISNGPILPISRFDPYLIGSADVVNSNGVWHMIYTSGIEWKIISELTELSYTLKYAYSSNGIDWTPTGSIVIQQESNNDAFAKPTIFRIDDKFIMYFSKRHIINYREKGESAYSLGSAYSLDLVNWIRDDSIIGMQASDYGWDSEMICYPNILKVNEKYLLFYNGNGFGKSGFGYAELEV